MRLRETFEMGSGDWAQVLHGSRLARRHDLRVQARLDALAHFTEN